ncbi:hypothetical protein ACFRJ1_32060 [Streptomyces sp. NPDC056773]|uniref:hypothetical protein n=1 Tax=unclassified Streptomyces TaxID=2593676 RepID=UPI003676BA24
MGWLEGVLWGAFGGFAMEAMDYIVAVRRWRKLPWDVGASSLAEAAPAPRQQNSETTAPGILAYLIAAILRVLVGGGVAAAFTLTDPGAMSAWLAVLVGATAPYVLEKVTLFVPLVARVGREGIAAVQQQSATQRQAGTVPALSPQVNTIPAPGSAAVMSTQDPAGPGSV